MNAVQCRMARAALNWSSRQIAVAAGVPRDAVARSQMGQAISETDIKKIRAAFEDAGIVFVDESGAPGVQIRLRQAFSAGGRMPVGPATDVVEAMDSAIERDRR